MKNILSKALILSGCLSVSAWATLFEDDYTTDTSANYQRFWTAGTFTHNTVNGTLDYARDDVSTWSPAVYLVRSNVFNLVGINTFTVKAQITYSDTVTGAQAGVVFATGNNEGGFVVFRHSGGNEWRISPLPNNLNDSSAPQTSIGAFDGLGTYDITLTFDRSGTDALVDVSIVGASNTRTITGHVFTNGATLGGNQVGWWVRNGSDAPTQSFGYLEVIPEPGTLALFTITGAGLWVARRRFRSVKNGHSPACKS